MHTILKTLAAVIVLAGAVICAGERGVAAEKQAAFTLAPVVVGEWLDAQGGGRGPNAFMDWAETHLTQEQIDSLETLIRSGLVSDEGAKHHLESALASLLKAGVDEDAPEVAAIRARREALEVVTP